MEIEEKRLYLKLDDLEIEEKNLLGINWDVVSEDPLFEGRALEEEGKKICEKLRKFEENQIVEVELETKNGFGRKKKILRIKEIKTPNPEMVAPVIYRFSGRLEMVKQSL